MTLLEDNGFEVYIIGGYVRDLLLDKPSADIDMTTNASPNQLCALFKDYPLSKIGAKLGTIGVKIQSQWIEITSYRTESTSSNFRHPDEVNFIGSLKDDVMRRDFTINALALNRKGEVIDYTGGKSDLIKRQIKAIGQPEDRFREDALRLLRALRFSAQLDFAIEANTATAIMAQRNLIKTLPIERIANEFDKLMQGSRLQNLFETYPQLLRMCLDFDSKGLRFIEQLPDKALRYVCLLDHLDLIETKNQLERLKLPKTFIMKVCVLKKIKTIQTNDRYELKKLLGTYGSDLIDLAVHYQKVSDFDGINEKIYTQLKAEKPCVSLKELAINGKDLLEMGISGQRIKTILSALLQKVMRDEVSNDNASLRMAVKELP